MKNIFLTFFLIVLGLSQIQAQKLRTVRNEAFDRGETLKYRVYYHSVITGNVTAGYGAITIMDTNRKFNGRNTYHIVASGKSSRFFDWFFKVNDRFESYMCLLSALYLCSIMPYFDILCTIKGCDLCFCHTQSHL